MDDGRASQARSAPALTVRGSFHRPMLARSETVKMDAPIMSFLVQHPKNGYKVIFDLGLPKDWDTSLPPHFVEKVRHAMGFEMHIPLDIVEV